MDEFSKEEALSTSCLLVFVRKQIDVLLGLYYDKAVSGPGGEDVKMAIDPVIKNPTNGESARLCLMALHTAPIEELELSLQRLGGILTGPILEVIKETKEGI